MNSETEAANNAAAVSQAGIAAGNYASTPNSGEFCGSLDATGAAVGAALVAAMKNVNSVATTRRVVDAKLENTRRILEATYSDSYPRIEIGDDSCLSIKLRWK